MHGRELHQQLPAGPGLGQEEPAAKGEKKKPWDDLGSAWIQWAVRFSDPRQKSEKNKKTFEWVRWKPALILSSPANQSGLLGIIEFPVFIADWTNFSGSAARGTASRLRAWSCSWPILEVRPHWTPLRCAAVPGFGTAIAAAAAWVSPFDEGNPSGNQKGHQGAAWRPLGDSPMDSRTLQNHDTLEGGNIDPSSSYWVNPLLFKQKGVRQVS